MRSRMIAFISGVIVFWLTPDYLQLPVPLNAIQLSVALTIFIVLIQSCKSSRRSFGILSFLFLIGFSLAQHQHQILQGQQLLLPSHQQTVTITGKISNTPIVYDNLISFQFQLESIDGQQLTGFWNSSVQLNWYSPKKSPGHGEYWEFQVRLKPLHGYSNPYGFDYERWGWANKIIARGYIDSKKEQRLIQTSTDRVIQWRTNLSMAIKNSQLPNTALIQSLITGDKKQMSKIERDSFQNSGLAHLLAISGLHIGMVALMSFFFLSRAWKLSSWLCLKIPAMDIAIIGTVIISTTYAVVSGWGIPVQRALLMLVLFSVNHLLRIRWQLFDILLFALCILTALNPVSILSTSSWLSFGAVFIIVGLLRYNRSSKPETQKTQLKSWIIFSILLWLGMMPLTMIVFGKIPMLGFIANLLAIPLMTYFIMPLLLIGALLFLIDDSVAIALWTIADYGLSVVYSISEVLAVASWQVSHQQTQGLLLSILIFLWFLPRALIDIKTAISATIIISCLVFFSTEVLQKPGAKLIVFDVGQGLAALWIEQDSDQMLTYVLIDAAYGNVSYQIAGTTWGPYFKGEGIETIDALLISHADNDHSGGVDYFSKKFKTKSAISGQQFDTKLNFLSCHQNYDVIINSTRIQSIKVYSEQELTFQKDNNKSCIFLLTYKGSRILLPGDIEASAEKRLVEQQLLAPVEVLVAPHHGSMTSSSSDFVKLTQPQFVLFSTGYLNRYKFPRNEISKRYLAQGSQLLNTAESGAIECEWNREGEFMGCYGHRKSEWGRWHWRQPE